MINANGIKTIVSQALRKSRRVVTNRKRLSRSLLGQVGAEDRVWG